MSEVKAVIIEDEYPTARLLNSMIAALRPEWLVTILPGSVSGAANWFSRNEQPDIIFLDIHLQNGDAFELLESVAPTGLIIFTTAYDEYAMRAFSVNSIDYLLKPIREERLAEAIGKFERLSQRQVGIQNQTIQHVLQVLKNPPPSSLYRTRFLISKGSEMHVVHVNDVAFIYTEERKTFAVTYENRTYMLDMRLDALMEQLDPKQFFRTNRQTIVNVHAIKRIEPYFHNSVVVHTEPEYSEKITVSKERLTVFKNWLNR